MGRGYVKKTGQRRNEDRALSVRAVHRAPADLHLLAQLLIRHALQQTGEARAAKRAVETPETFKTVRSSRPAAPPLVVSSIRQ